VELDDATLELTDAVVEPALVAVTLAVSPLVVPVTPPPAPVVPLLVCRTGSLEQASTPPTAAAVIKVNQANVFTRIDVSWGWKAISSLGSYLLRCKPFRAFPGTRCVARSASGRRRARRLPRPLAG
jgi:hypothetical protein